MAEDLKAKLAAINAAKMERAKTDTVHGEAIEEGRLRDSAKSEVNEAHGEALEENVLRDRATTLEGEVVGAEQSALEAEDAIKQAEGMITEGGLEADELSAIEGIKTEAGEKIIGLRGVEEDLARTQNEIIDLNRKPEVALEVQSEIPSTQVVAENNLRSTVETKVLSQEQENRLKEISKELSDLFKEREELGASEKALLEQLKKEYGVENLGGGDDEIALIKDKAAHDLLEKQSSDYFNNKPDAVSYSELMKNYVDAFRNAKTSFFGSADAPLKKLKDAYKDERFDDILDLAKKADVISIKETELLNEESELNKLKNG